MALSNLTPLVEIPKLLEDIKNGTPAKLKVDMNIPEIYKAKAHGDRPFIKGKRQALIVNIINVKGQKPRKGADVDSHYLEKLLPELGFDVHVVPESKTTKSGIVEELQTFTNICVRNEVDCFLIYIGSHGMNDILFTADGKTLDIYSDLIYPFQFKVFEEKNGESVEKKRVVRVFLNQSCQDEPSQFQRDAITPESVDMKDTIYMKAQIPKYPAYRNKRFGSYFVLVLTYVLMKKAWDTSLLDMLYEVQVLLKTLTKPTKKPTKKRARLAQFPQILMMGLKEPFYFFKNPYEVHFDVSRPVNIFTGRNHELLDLRQKFQRQKQMDPRAEAYTVSIVGMGGIGKSELARKYCREFVGAIIWLNAETDETLTESFRILATEHLNIPSKNDDETEKSTATIITKVFMHFHGKPCLFVFDNLETDEILPKFKKFAQSNPSPPFVLITSQFKIRTTGNEEILELTEFTTEEAVELVKNCLKIQNEEQDENVLKLVGMMQRLPLALTHAISYISRGSGLWTNAIGTFLKKFSMSSKILFETGNSSNMYTKTIYTTFKITFDLICKRDHGEKAIRLLRILSYFQPDRIPTGLFNSGDYKDALELLLEFSVVTVQSKDIFIRIHRLMQDFVRMNLKESEMEKRILKEALTILSQNASQDTAVHLFSVLKYWNNIDALKDVVEKALSAHFKDSKIMTSLLSSSKRMRYLTIVKNGENEKDWNVTMDLSGIIGIGRDPPQIPETYILSHALQTSQDMRAKILFEHFVQYYTCLEWEKMSWKIRIWFTSKIVWLAIFCGISYKIVQAIQENARSTTEELHQLGNESLKLFPEDKSLNDYRLSFINKDLFCLTILILFEYIIEIISLPAITLRTNLIEKLCHISIGMVVSLLFCNILFPNYLPVLLVHILSFAAAKASMLLLIWQHSKLLVVRNGFKMLKETVQAVGCIFLTVVLIRLFLLGVIYLILMGWKLFHEENYTQKFPKCKTLIIVTMVLLSTLGIKHLMHFLIDFVGGKTKKLQENTRVKSLATLLEDICSMEAMTIWYPDLAEACRITEDKSRFEVWALKCLNFLYGELNTSTSTLPEIEQQQHDENQFYVVKKPMTEFSSESRSLLMNLQAENDLKRHDE